MALVSILGQGGASSLKRVTGSVSGTATKTPAQFSVPGLTKILAFFAYGNASYSMGACRCYMRPSYDAAFINQGATGSTTTSSYCELAVSGIADNVITYYSVKGTGSGEYNANTMYYMALGE